MTVQPTLFPVGRARASDPGTSHEAAAGISDRTERLIVETIRDAPFGLTADELVANLPPSWYAPTVKTALARCHKRGAVKDSGRRRLSSRGRQSIVWTTKEQEPCSGYSSESRS